MSLLIVNCSNENIDCLKFLETNLRRLKFFDGIIFNLRLNSKMLSRFNKIVEKLQMKIMEDQDWYSYYLSLTKKDNINSESIKDIVEYYYLIGKKDDNIITNGSIIQLTHQYLNIDECIDFTFFPLNYFKEVIIFDCCYLILREIKELFYGNFEITSICGCFYEEYSILPPILVRFNISSLIDYINQEQIFDESKKSLFINSKDINIIYSTNDFLDRFSNKGIFPLVETHSINGNKISNKEVCRLKRIQYYCDINLGLYSFYMKQIEESRKKYLTIYCYYEKDGHKKNQTNLQHFINHGLSIENMDYIFNINGYKCSVNIPDFDNIKIFKRDNCMDFEGWYHCLMEIDWFKYQYIFFINCSVLGPLNLNNTNEITTDWFTPFLNKMDSETVLCSNVITNFSSKHPAGSGPRCTSYCFLLDTKILPILMTKRIFCGDYYNTVFGRKKDRKDAILTGEYGLSIVIIDMGYNITCLHPNYSDRSSHDICVVDFKPTIQMTLFMKNNWIDGNFRVCPPIQYHRCMEIIGKKIKEVPEAYDYSKLKCDETGICYGNKSFNWKSKREFYENFGYSEEIEL